MADHFSEEEQIAALKQFWADYGTGILGGLVLILGGYFGWQYYQDYSAQRAEEASALYQSYVQGRDMLVDAEAQYQLLETLDTRHAGSSYQIFTLFFRAQDALAQDDLEQAARHLQTAVDRAKDAHLRDVARVRLARVQVQQQDTEAALRTLQAVRGAGFRAQAAEIQGDILILQDDKAGAREAYSRALALLGENASNSVLELKLTDLAVDD